VCVAVVCEAQQGIREASRRQLLVHGDSAVLTEGVGELERVELDVCIASYAPVSYAQATAPTGAGDAHVSYQNKLPIFTRQVLVGGLDDGIVEDVGLGAEHGVCVSPVGDGTEVSQRRNCGLEETEQEGRGERHWSAVRYSCECRIWEM
jgi:hypothetical protein